MLGEMLLELKQPAAALKEFEAALRMEPNRRRSLKGAGRAAELAGGTAAAGYHARLVEAGAGATRVVSRNY
jgi:hypothetical protein